MNNAYVSIFDPPHSSNFATYSARAHMAMEYLSQDNTLENVHLCAFMGKLQANADDNSTYGNILKYSSN